MNLYEEIKHIHSLMSEKLKENPDGGIDDYDYCDIAERLSRLIQEHDEKEAYRKQVVERPWEVFYGE